MMKKFTEYKPNANCQNTFDNPRIIFNKGREIDLNEDYIESSYVFKHLQEDKLFTFKHVTMVSGKEHFLLESINEITEENK